MTTTQIVIVLLVAAVASIVKSTTGMGYPLVLLPVLALFIDVAEAIVIVTPANLILNAKLARKLHTHHGEAVTLLGFLKGAAVGAVVGTAMLPILPDRGLRIILIVGLVLFLFNRLSPRSFTIGEEQGERLAPPVGLVAGLFQGAAGISGPIVSPWFLSVGVARDVFIYSMATVFALSGVMQIGVLVIQGSFTWELLAVGVTLIPIAFALFPLGAVLRSRISVDAFERIVLLLLAGSAISLLVKVI